MELWLEKYSQLFWTLSTEESGFNNWFVAHTQMLVAWDDITLPLRKILIAVPAKTDSMYLFTARNVSSGN